MFLDTPATIAILGGGPIGIESALYARFLGYDVTIVERGEPFGRLRRWKHLRLLSAFRDHRSSLGLAALEAHDQDYQPPDDDAELTIEDWVRLYLLPLSQTDLIADHIQSLTEVTSIKRVAWNEQEGASDRSSDVLDETDDEPQTRPRYEVMVEAQGGPQTMVFDAVIDATGADVAGGSSRVDPQDIKSIRSDDDGQLFASLDNSNDEIRLAQMIDSRLDAQLTLQRSSDVQCLAAMLPWLEQPHRERLQFARAASSAAVESGEPNLFVIGTKSFGQHTSFRFAIGLEQIRIVFGELGGRSDLDLYRNFAKP